MSDNTNMTPSVVVSQQIHVATVQVNVESEAFQDKVRKFRVISIAGRTGGNSNSNNNRDLEAVGLTLDVRGVGKDSCKGMRRHRKVETSPTQHPYKRVVCFKKARKLLKPVDFKYSPRYNTLGK